MIITLISGSTIKVNLSDEDMRSYNMEFEKLDKTNSVTKLFLLRIVGEIKKLHDIDLSHEKLYIEAFQQNSGGCLIYISISGDKFKHRSKPYTELVYEFEQLADLVAICSRLWTEYSYMFRGSELYCSDKNYRLILRAFSKAEKKLCNMLNEYGFFLGTSEITVAATKEHYSPIIEKNAVEMLSSIS